MSRRFLSRSPGEQSPVTVGGLAPFLSVFKTGYGGVIPRWEGSIRSPRR
jgi:hypothetical protein